MLHCKTDPDNDMLNVSFDEERMDDIYRDNDIKIEIIKTDVKKECSTTEESESAPNLYLAQYAKGMQYYKFIIISIKYSEKFLF